MTSTAWLLPWQRLVRRWRTSRAIGLYLGLLALVLLGAAGAPLIALLIGSTPLAVAWQSPSLAHWLGTDQIGRDVFMQLLWACRGSLGFALIASGTSLVLGVLCGVLAAHYGGRREHWLMRVTRVFESLPLVLIVIALAAFYRLDWYVLALLAGAVTWMSTARRVRYRVASLYRADFTVALRVLGARQSRILGYHLAPHLMGVVSERALRGAAHMLLLDALVSLLGVGPQAPNVSLGSLLAVGVAALETHPHVFVVSALALTFIIYGVTTLADVWREALADGADVTDGGRVVEQGSAAAVLEQPEDPSAVPEESEMRVADRTAPDEVAAAADENEWLLEACALEAYDAAGRRALQGVSFALAKGEALGVVGESGSGITLLPQVLLELAPASAGSVRLHGENLCELAPEELRLQRQYLQGIGPAPQASIDPSLPMLAVIEEPLRIFRPQASAIERRERVYSMLGAVGLQPRHLVRFAHELNGEEALRVVLARALILKPDVLVWAEPRSGLDSGARAACSQLLRNLRAAFGFSVLLMASDWRDLRGNCERVLVLYAGHVVEAGACGDVYRAPVHPYTRALLESAPADPLPVDRRSSALPVVPAAPGSVTGCAFRERCPHAIARCEAETPLLRDTGARLVACHRAAELSH